MTSSPDDHDVTNKPREYLADFLDYVDYLFAEANRLDLTDRDRGGLAHAVERLKGNVEPFLDLVETVEREMNAPGLASHLVLHFDAALRHAFRIGQIATTGESTWKFARQKQSRAARDARKAQRVAEAEKVRAIIEGAERKNGRIVGAIAVRKRAAQALGKQDIDAKTFKGYVEHIATTGKTVIAPKYFAEE